MSLERLKKTLTGWRKNKPTDETDFVKGYDQALDEVLMEIEAMQRAETPSGEDEDAD